MLMMRRSTMINYYKILGVSEDADTKEIKSKYRKLAMKYQS